MYIMSAVPPERMTPEARRREIARLWAVGLVRLRHAGRPKHGPMLEKEVGGLDFLTPQRVHTHLTHPTTENG